MEYIHLLNKVKDLINSNVCEKESLLLDDITNKLEELRAFFQRPLKTLLEEIENETRRD